MCRNLLVRATLDDGSPNPYVPETIEFEVPDTFDELHPTCTCWIGDNEGKGAVLRRTFVEECVRPFLEQVEFGNIIIEIR